MAADTTYPKGCQIRQDGNIRVPTGAFIDIESGGQIRVAGSDVTSSVAGAGVAGVAAGYKIARGVAAITGTGTVVTGLSTVVAVIACPASDLDGDALAGVSATIGDQAGSPAAGSVILKCWKSAGDGDATLIAATAAKNVNWIAIGT